LGLEAKGGIVNNNRGEYYRPGEFKVELLATCRLDRVQNLE
jgi:hypothetical protein